MTIITPQKQQRGLSLVELMIAITLSLVLTLGVIQIFSSSKQTNRTQSALGNLQENARFALDLLSYDLRMAGNIGCNRAAVINNLAADAKLPEIGNGVSGFKESQLGADVFPLLGSKAIPSKADVVDGTDIIVVRYASPNSFAIDSVAADQKSTTLNASKTKIADAIKKGVPIVISDCQSADIFVAGDIDGKTIKTAAGIFSKKYGTDAEVAPLKYVAYYIRKSEGHNNLYRNIVNSVSGKLDVQDAEPLLEGVEDLQVLYGEDLNGDGSNIRYVAADTADMNKVTSIRLSLLFSTIDNNLASGDQNYWFNGERINVAVKDNDNKKLYRAFTTTIKLRNQGIGL